MTMTLHDAFQGLLRYWKLRPNGGTKAELLALAVQQGFEEPLLDQWLTVFINGFAASKRITVATYDDGLAPLVAAIGVPAATIAATEVYEYLLRSGRALDTIKRLDAANHLQELIDTLNTDLARLASATTAVENNLNGVNRATALVAINEAVAGRQKRVQDLIARRLELLG